jgi:branched-chain amino acid transport system ATP-binding protein
MICLSVDSVAKEFGGLKALSDVSFEVEEREILGIMGANGAGKTTLFGLIAGHLRPTGGDIRFCGQSIVGLRPDQICRRGIARTFQIVKPFGGLTVLENLMTAAMFGAARIHHPERARQHCQEILAELDMARLQDRPAHALTLSGQKKLELARAVATGCQLIMLDEVMAGLTPTEVTEMLEIIRTVHRARGLTILLIEHVMKALMRLSDRVLVLHLGHTVACAPPADIAADPRVHEIYLGESA